MKYYLFGVCSYEHDSSHAWHGILKLTKDKIFSMIVWSLKHLFPVVSILPKDFHRAMPVIGDASSTDEPWNHPITCDECNRSFHTLTFIHRQIF
ncbi:MAG: hypothetical protein GF311_02965 [Candidatus Lokiarchaeota archaeon]|nr:hypothetical protein [Candidatus Lokiarchaeota archaeon]